ncbi:MAG: YqeG family HAD IIIA-type phosphatase [Lachnospiraceae bacterium]|nr:YqeG family HAD IIIA-type phosphatase [Lachnospiraceae bacterium]
MWKKFYPDEYVDSAYEIDYEELYREGYRGILFDIDNTLVPHGLPADQRAKDLFKRLRQLGYHSLLLSNNKESRVKTFAEAVGAECIYKANKPAVKGYLKAMEKLHTNKRNTLFVGDQLFTDIWGAGRVGIRNFLVKPIHSKEEIQIVLKRFLEKIVLYFYLKDRKKKR